jgi:hypothetical protein
MDKQDESRSGRRWSLEAARALMPDVRKRTEQAAREAERLDAERERVRAPDERQRLDLALSQILDRWRREIEALGAEVKGVWLVDFDNGSGYYCWQWPEDELDHFHGYEEGFEGRTRIQ